MMTQKEQFKSPVAIELKKGFAAFHHPLMVHGSYENKSEISRRAFVLNVFADGTVSDTNDELLAGVPPIPKGHKMEGKFFPLLYEELELQFFRTLLWYARIPVHLCYFIIDLQEAYEFLRTNFFKFNRAFFL